MKVFISGSITIKKLPKIAIEKIDNIIKQNFTVLIGDANGVDSHVQKYLFGKGYRNVIVYFAGNQIRNNLGQWKTENISASRKTGRELYTLKDVKMANDANYGLMIWDGKSEGTLNNINVMKSKSKRFFVILNGTLIADQNIDSVIAGNKPIEQKIEKQIELF